MSSTTNLQNLQNDCLLRALRREEVEYTPIWLMRQAGRYLPEYRALRARVGDFMTLCKTPELAAEVTMQPVRRFPKLDAAIIFSDILTVPDAMGLGLTVEEGVGPKFRNPLRGVGALPELDVGKDLGYVMQAIQLAKEELKGSIPLIGFSGSPWTVAAYMVEGGASKDFRRAKGMLHEQPDKACGLLDKMSAAIAEYLKAQIEAGVDAVMIFDTWGGLLSASDYARFSLEYMALIVAALKADAATRDTPVILFTKGGGNWLEEIADSGCDAVGLDWTIPYIQARERIGRRVALQGNLDPSLLYAPHVRIAGEAQRILQQAEGVPGHVFNLGHGVLPDVNPSKVGFLIDTVHRISRELKKKEG